MTLAAVRFPALVVCAVARIVALFGDLDVYNAPTACRALDAIDGDGIIDLSGVTLLCGEGLGELARVARRAEPGALALTGASPNVRRVLRLVRFDQIFAISAGG